MSGSFFLIKRIINIPEVAMNGKEKCALLKQIRARIAEENNIPFAVKECTHQGHCSGTCPRCESELRYLEGELKKRSSAGKRVTVAAICAGMALTAAGCDMIDNIRSRIEPTETPEVFVLDGEVGLPYEPEPTNTVPAAKSGTTVEIVEELSGMVPSN